MSSYDEELEKAQEEEQPGPADLESVLVNETISDAMSHAPLVLDPDTSLADVIKALQEAGHGCALLVRDDRLVGIFTERDVLMRIAGHPIDLAKTKVSAYMTKDPVSLPANSSVAYALNKMVVEGFRHVPLVDDSGRPTGVVSMRELIQFMSDFFRRDVLTMPPDPRLTPRSRDGA